MYHQDRDRLHAPSPIIKQMISAGLRGRKTGRGFYTYAEPGSAEVVPDRETPDLAAQAAATSRPIETVGVVGSGTMATGIVEVFAKAGFPVTVRGAWRGQGRRRFGRDRQEHGQVGRARPDDAGGRRRGARAADRLDLEGGPRRRRHRRRGDRRGAGRQAGPLPRPGQDLQAGCDPGHDDLVAAGHRVWQRHQPHPGRHRHALLQPGAGHAPGRDRAHRRHGRRRHQHDGATSPARSASTRSSARTAPASSSTRCCSRTSTTR